MSIVDALLGQVREEVQKSGHGGRVVRLDLVVGRLSGVHVDAIRFAFEVLSPGSIADGADLNIEQPKAELCCGTCGNIQPIDQLHVSCSACGGADVVIRGGQELLLASIELEEQEEEPERGVNCESQK